jgi:3-methyl-2-oxobutanoate hydroxymethyltransferase
MGHLGLTPQSVNAFGGYRVQGRDAEAAHRLVQDAKDLEVAGAFSVVLEAVPSAVAKEVTGSLSVPTIGIGAGPHTDGQVLVLHDIVGLTHGRTPRFVKRYAEVGEAITGAARAFAEEVASGAYPAPEHTYE